MVMPAFIVCVGLGVDFAGHASAEQEARAVAQEAARAGGQYLVLSGGRARPDIHHAQRAANSYLAASSLSGNVVVGTGGDITVEVSGRYPTQFLGMIGINSLPLHATGSAHVVSVIDGNEE